MEANIKFLLKNFTCSKDIDDTSSVKNSSGSDSLSVSTLSLVYAEDCYCEVCLLSEINLGKLLTCKDCGAKAHVTCVRNYAFASKDFLQREHWQCSDCKCCSICNKIGAGNDQLVVCCKCMEGFHAQCYMQNIVSKLQGPLSCDCGSNLCSQCKLEIRKITFYRRSPGKGLFVCSKCELDHKNGVTRSVKRKSSAASCSPCISDKFLKRIRDYPKVVPLAKYWSVENVVAFFKYLGFEDEAPVFELWGIDGQTLLHLKEDEFFKGLGLESGCASEIYKHVLNLQSRAFREISQK